MMRSARFVLAGLLVLTGVGATTGAAAGAKGVLRLQTDTVNMSGLGPVSLGSLDITIERWSSDQERDRLRSALVNKGPEAMLAALQTLKPRAGYIRNPASMTIGWNLRFAREDVMPDGGRRIILATDRPLSYRALVNRPYSADFAFTLAEIHLDKNGKGEGKLVPAAKVTWNEDKNTIEITDYGIEPVRLEHVTVERL